MRVLYIALLALSCLSLASDREAGTGILEMKAEFVWQDQNWQEIGLRFSDSEFTLELRAASFSVETVTPLHPSGYLVAGTFKGNLTLDRQVLAHATTETRFYMELDAYGEVIDLKIARHSAHGAWSNPNLPIGEVDESTDPDDDPEGGG